MFANSKTGLRMLKNYFYLLKTLLFRLSLVYAAFFFSRLLFFGCNRSFFFSASISDLLLDCLYGLRFDRFSVVAANGIFILCSILPFNFQFNKGFQRFLLVIFILFKALFLL